MTFAASGAALPPCVIIHGLIDAKRALAPGLPVALLSAPGAARFGGCLWWFSLMEAVSEVSGQPAPPNLLDCADAPGRAVEALRMGLKGIVLGCEPALFQTVSELAAIYQALLLPAPPRALDMAGHGAAYRLETWLKG